MAKKSFPILGKTLEISEERDRYVAYRNLTSALSKGVSQEFISLYSQNVSSLRDALNKSVSIATDILEPKAKVLVAFYLKSDILDITEDDIIEEIINYEFFYKAYKQIEIEYKEINSAAEVQKSIVQAEGETGGSWSGGGFGLKGALTGAAMAGAFNMIEGAGKSLSASIKSDKIDDAAFDMIHKIFKNPNTLHNLANGLQRDVFCYHICMMDKMSNKYNFDFVSTDDSTQAEKIFENIKNPILSETQKNDMIIKVLELNPYYQPVYNYVFENYDVEEKRNIINLSNYFKIDMQYQLYLYTLANDKWPSTLSELLKYKEEMLHKLKEIGAEKYLESDDPLGEHPIDKTFSYADIHLFKSLRNATELGAIDVIKTEMCEFQKNEIIDEAYYEAFSKNLSKKQDEIENSILNDLVPKDLHNVSLNKINSIIEQIKNLSCSEDNKKPYLENLEKAKVCSSLRERIKAFDCYFDKNNISLSLYEKFIKTRWLLKQATDSQNEYTATLLAKIYNQLEPNIKSKFSSHAVKYMKTCISNVADDIKSSMLSNFTIRLADEGAMFNDALKSYYKDDSSYSCPIMYMNTGNEHLLLAINGIFYPKSVGFLSTKINHFSLFKPIDIAFENGTFGSFTISQEN